VTARLALVFLVLATGRGFAQSAPPDLNPRLTVAPVDAQQTGEKEKPRLQEPPRPPVAQEGVLTPSPPALTTPTR